MKGRQRPDESPVVTDETWPDCPCGRTSEIRKGRLTVFWKRCPLHKTAADMLAFLKSMEILIRVNAPIHHGSHAYKECVKLIEAAGGKP